LDEIVADARYFADDVAERMRAVYVAPDGRAQTVAKVSGLKPFPEGEISTSEAVDAISAALYGVAKTAREIHDDVEEEDPTTSDLLHTIIERTEQLAWMVSAENRTPQH
jgi:starvation-inducible DNA-binding protein